MGKVEGVSPRGGGFHWGVTWLITGLTPLTGRTEGSPGYEGYLGPKEAWGTLRHCYNCPFVPFLAVIVLGSSNFGLKRGAPPRVGPLLALGFPPFFVGVSLEILRGRNFSPAQEQCSFAPGVFLFCSPLLCCVTHFWLPVTRGGTHSHLGRGSIRWGPFLAPRGGRL